MACSTLPRDGQVLYANASAQAMFGQLEVGSLTPAALLPRCCHTSYCDIGLPGIDGFEVARAFRADETLRGIFLVALSGYALPEDVQRAAEAGFERHLAKPPDLEALERLLAEVRPIGDHSGPDGPA